MQEQTAVDNTPLLALKENDNQTICNKLDEIFSELQKISREQLGGKNQQRNPIRNRILEIEKELYSIQTQDVVEGNQIINYKRIFWNVVQQENDCEFQEEATKLHEEIKSQNEKSDKNSNALIREPKEKSCNCCEIF